MRAEFEKLALAYLRLAEQATRNATLDLVYEAPSEQRAVRQQQQQPRPKDESDDTF
jgi:hypothetical protein